MNWLIATRAAAHAAVALVITFYQFHTVEFGYISLILFSALYLAASLGTHLLDHRFKVMSARLGLPLIPVLVVAPAAIYLLSIQWFTLLNLRILLAALCLGFLIVELYLAKKVGRKSPDGRDAILTAYLSLAMLGLILGFSLNAKSMIGFFGAYQAILAVHLGIAAVAPKK